MTCCLGILELSREVRYLDFLLKLEKLLISRKEQLPPGSYTAGLFEGGLDRILKKIGEEAGEVIIAAKNQDSKELVYESADLLFHLQLLLVSQGISIAEVEKELQNRHS